MLHECPKCRILNAEKDGRCRCTKCGRLLLLNAEDVREVAARVRVRQAMAFAPLSRHTATCIGDGCGHTPAA